MMQKDLCKKDIKSAVLILSCPDREGIVAKVSSFVYKRMGNIIDFDQYVDQQEKILFMRLEWSLEKFKVSNEKLIKEFKVLADKLKASWEIKFIGSYRKKVAIMVSGHLHCLMDLLWRQKMGELNCELSLIISNHLKAKDLADNFKIPFYYTPFNKNKMEVEKEQIRILKFNKIDLVVLARYMQILSDSMIEKFKNRIINIHHSFLPAFAGSDPYRQALERVFKVIGATSHYATEDLDEGPIIHQDVIRISHKDSLSELKRKGRDLERIVLAEAVRLHLDNRILVYGKKTIIFGS